MKKILIKIIKLNIKMSLTIKNLKPEIINEPKKKFMSLKNLDLNTAQFIKDEWHHAIITYFNLKPLFKDQFSELILKREDIENIKKYYGISPSEEYLEMEKQEQERKEKERKSFNPLKKLDFYEEDEIIECNESPFIFNIKYYISEIERQCKERKAKYDLLEEEEI